MTAFDCSNTSVFPDFRGNDHSQQGDVILRHAFHFQASFAGLVSLLLVLCSNPVSAAGKTEINSGRDGKVLTTACLAHLAGKPPTTAVSQSGFATKKSNRRVTQYRKDVGGGLLPTYLVLNLLKKPNKPTYRGCNFVLSLPKRLLTLTIPPEPRAALNALRTTLKSTRLSYIFLRFPCEKGATDWHLIYAGQWRRLDRE
ncbi:MAG: hypothetical protein ACI8Q6_002751, partial [Granulosicoccus sp.]